VDDETDYKLLVIKAYEGGMSTWPPSTSHGLTQAEVDILVDGAADHDVPTGDSISTDYIDSLDADIINALDVAVIGVPEGSKSKYTKLKADYLANHVSLHNDYQQQQILTDPNTGILATAFIGMSDAATGITDPKDMMAELKTVRDTLAAHFTAAASSVVTDENKSGGATSNEYQIFGNKMVAILDDMIAGKYGSAKAVDLLSATVKSFPDYKDNWVQMAFGDETLKAMFIGTDDAPSGFQKLEYFAQGYKGVTSKPPTRAFVYDYADGVGFVPVREVTTMVDGKPVKKYEPVLPVQAPKADGTTDAWTMVSMDVNGVPTLVPALASVQTENVPMGVFDPVTGKAFTDSNQLFNFYSKLVPPSDITKYIKPLFTVYTVKIGTGDSASEYSYVGGTVSANGTLAGGTWVPTKELGKVYGGTAYEPSDPKLATLLQNSGIVFFNDPSKPYDADATIAGEPIVYLGDNQAIFRAILKGTISDPNGILTEAQRHGMGLDDGKISVYDEGQIDIWAEGYDGIRFSGPRGFTGGVGRRTSAPGGVPTSSRGGLGTPEKWNAASEGKALYHYDRDYIAYTNVEPPAKKGNDPIAQILGEEEGDVERGYRYAPRVPGNEFSPASVAGYAATAAERDKGALPKISIADSWDRGIQTLPVAPTAPAPTAPTPPPPSSSTPTPPTTPKPPAPPRDRRQF
jgi:hypothetical protein